MSYTLKIENRAQFLYASVTGTMSADTLIAYLKEALDACAEYGHDYLLIEENLDGPSLNTFEVYEVVARTTERSSLRLHTIAYADVNPDHDPEQSRFGETVARNRSVNVKVFSDVEEAEAWLLAQLD